MIDKVSVDVDGIACEVQTVMDTMVTCFTGPPPSHSRASHLFNDTLGISSTVRFEGT